MLSWLKLRYNPFDSDDAHNKQQQQQQQQPDLQELSSKNNTLAQLVNGFLYYVKSINFFDTVLPNNQSSEKDQKNSADDESQKSSHHLNSKLKDNNEAQDNNEAHDNADEQDKNRDEHDEQQQQQQQQDNYDNDNKDLFPKTINYDKDIFKGSTVNPCSMAEKPAKILKFESIDGVINWKFDPNSNQTNDPKMAAQNINYSNLSSPFLASTGSTISSQNEFPLSAKNLNFFGHVNSPSPIATNQHLHAPNNIHQLQNHNSFFTTATIPTHSDLDSNHSLEDELSKIPELPNPEFFDIDLHLKGQPQFQQQHQQQQQHQPQQHQQQQQQQQAQHQQQLSQHQQHQLFQQQALQQQQASQQQNQLDCQQLEQQYHQHIGNYHDVHQDISQVSSSKELSLNSPTLSDSSSNSHPDMMKKSSKVYICDYCGSEFRIRGYLTRHIKKHAITKAYECPFFDAKSDSKCHPNGGFSRRDTYKTHLKARHFKYPPGTKSQDRTNTPGKCGLCSKHYDNNEEWVEKHIENGECEGLPKGFQIRIKNSRKKNYEFPNLNESPSSINDHPNNNTDQLDDSSNSSCESSNNDTTSPSSTNSYNFLQSQRPQFSSQQPHVQIQQQQQERHQQYEPLHEQQLQQHEQHEHENANEHQMKLQQLQQLQEQQLHHQDQPIPQSQHQSNPNDVMLLNEQQNILTKKIILSSLQFKEDAPQIKNLEYDENDEYSLDLEQCSYRWPVQLSNGIGY